MVHKREKKVLAQKEIKEKLPKLTSFFTVEETNKSGSCSSSSPRDKNTSENNQEKEVITCNVCNENDKHTSIAELSTSSNCELIIANLKIISVSHDPGQYCDDILTGEVRNIWIRKWPEFFQNKHCDFSETLQVFQIQAVKPKLDT